ncbi:hypothetical protein EJA70_18530 [Pseudomonas sp. PB103]|nr:hypothetical protein EJA70_18530 [Pseudomonas sp. PB103]
MLAKAAFRPTHFLQRACNLCGSWLASDGGLTPNQSPLMYTAQAIRQIVMLAELAVSRAPDRIDPQS